MEQVFLYKVYALFTTKSVALQIQQARWLTWHSPYLQPVRSVPTKPSQHSARLYIGFRGPLCHSITLPIHFPCSPHFSHFQFMGVGGERARAAKATCQVIKHLQSMKVTLETFFLSLFYFYIFSFLCFTFTSGGSSSIVSP